MSGLRYSIGKLHRRQATFITVFTHYFIVHRTNIKLSWRARVDQWVR